MPPPRRPRNLLCPVCKFAFDVKKRGPIPETCSRRCALAPGRAVGKTNQAGLARDDARSFSSLSPADKAVERTPDRCSCAAARPSARALCGDWSLLALLDDITGILDDVSAMTKVAAGKTAGVLGDDLALNAQQVAEVRADLSCRWCGRWRRAPR